MMSSSDLPPSSGDSPHGHASYSSRHAHHQSMTSGVRVLRPTAVTEKSLMESVAGFINEVQASVFLLTKLLFDLIMVIYSSRTKAKWLQYLFQCQKRGYKTSFGLS